MKTMMQKRKNTNQDNTRIKKTKQLIKQAFIDLVELNGYRNVTVKDIIEYAQINRNTFYLHYANKEDLSEKIILELIENQFKLLSYSIQNIIESEKQEIVLYQNIKQTLEILSKEIEFYRILFLDDTISGYLHSSFRKRLRAYLDTNQSLRKDNEFKIFESLLIDGILGVIGDWVIKDNFTIEELASVLSKIISLYVISLQYK